LTDTTDHILTSLLQGAGRPDSVPLARLRSLEAEGYIEAAGTERTGARGRPAHLFKLTAKGRKRANLAR
jgi:hypothetical protein